MAGFGFFMGYLFLRIPYEIQIRDDRIIEFRSVLRRTAITPEGILSIRAKRSQMGFADVRTSAGRIRLITQMDGFHEFLSRLKSLNPAVEIKGC